MVSDRSKSPFAHVLASGGFAVYSRHLLEEFLTDRFMEGDNVNNSRYSVKVERPSGIYHPRHKLLDDCFRKAFSASVASRASDEWLIWNDNYDPQNLSQQLDQRTISGPENSVQN